MKAKTAMNVIQYLIDNDMIESKVANVIKIDLSVLNDEELAFLEQEIFKRFYVLPNNQTKLSVRKRINYTFQLYLKYYGPVSLHDAGNRYNVKIKTSSLHIDNYIKYAFSIIMRYLYQNKYPDDMKIDIGMPPVAYANASTLNDLGIYTYGDLKSLKLKIFNFREILKNMEVSDEC